MIAYALSPADRMSPMSRPRFQVVRSASRPRLWLPILSLAVCAIIIFVVGVVKLLQSDRQRPSPNGRTSLSSNGKSESYSTTNLKWQEFDDPRSDGWDTEIFSDMAGERLKKIGNLLIGESDSNDSELTAFIATDFQCDALLPRLREVYADDSLVVHRMFPESSETESLPFVGLDGLLNAIADWKKNNERNGFSRFHLKLFNVTNDSDSITTRQHISTFSDGGDSRIEQHATWVTRWTTSSAEAGPQLLSLTIEDFEQVKTHSAMPLFSDCTDSALAHNASFDQQILRGWNDWLQRSQDDRYFFILGTPGIAVGDMNGDGLDDLYLCQEFGLPNRFFQQQMNGQLRDVSVESGANWLEKSRSALLVDLDNDGDQDLAVVTMGALVVAEADGSGHFSVRQTLKISDDGMSLSAADYDLDGRLDLYVCSYAANPTRVAIAAEDASFVLHDANNGAENFLFRNEITTDSWRFRDVTSECNLNANNRRWSLSASWEDFDNDGDQDLYVANDYGRNNLYRNDLIDGRRRFVDIAAPAGVEDSASGMSVSWGDYDHDGLMDIYVSNMYSAAGNRIVFQQKFKPDAPREIKQRLQRFARGNTLFRNRGDGTFEDASQKANVSMGRWAWGAGFVDINNDSWEDLIVANGYITTSDTSDL